MFFIYFFTCLFKNALNQLPQRNYTFMVAEATLPQKLISGKRAIFFFWEMASSKRPFSLHFPLREIGSDIAGKTHYVAGEIFYCIHCGHIVLPLIPICDLSSRPIFVSPLLQQYCQPFLTQFLHSPQKQFSCSIFSQNFTSLGSFRFFSILPFCRRRRRHFPPNSNFPT